MATFAGVPPAKTTGLTLEESAPIPLTERREALDVLRGFALIGVLLVNLRDFTGVRPHGSLHIVARDVIDIVASGKFATLFQLMFGIGFAIQIARWNDEFVTTVSRYLRRALGLWLIGWAAIILAGGGDTLQRYAVSSLGLLIFWKARQRTLLLVVPILFIGSALGADAAAAEKIRSVWRGSATVADSTRIAEADQRMRTMTRTIFETRRTGSYLENARAWTAVTLERFPALVLVPDRVGLRTLSVFLLGLLLWRAGLIQNPGRHVKLLRLTGSLGLLIGLGGQAAWVMSRGARSRAQFGQTLESSLDLANELSILALALSYAAVIILAVHAGAPRWLSALRFSGRMGLTVFVLQWLAIRLAFSGFGLDAGGKLGYAWSIPLAVALTALFLLLARQWFTRFSVGPLEWVWRLMTYGPRGRAVR